MKPRELPPLNALRAFEAVARLQSVTRAATELHVTHGAVSRQLRVLDEALGKPLFQRQGRRLALTSTGEQLHAGAGAAFEQLRDTWAQLQLRDSQTPLVLGCPGSLLARWVIPRLDRLNRDLPEIALHLSAHDDPLATASNELDAALLLGAPPWPARWEVDVLAPEVVGPVVSPRYSGWPRLQGQAASSLLDEPVLHTSSRPQAWVDWSHAAGLPTLPATMGQGFAHLYYLLEAAIAGLGVAIAPAPLVADDVAAGRLLAPWGFLPLPSAWVLATPVRMRDRRTTVLADWLRSELGSI